MELQTIVCRKVVGIKIPVGVAAMIIAENTANWETPTGFGLPLLIQVLQIGHGAWVSTVGMCTTAVRILATTIFVV